MDLTKLNNRAVAHRSNPCEETFNELYREARNVFSRAHRTRVIRSGYGDEHDADEIFDTAVLKLTRSPKHLDLEYEQWDFGRMLSTALKNGMLNHIKSVRKYHNLCILGTESTGDEDAPTSEVRDEYNLEEEVLSQLRKKEDDQRQLIVSLTDPTQVDHDTTLIVSQFPQHDSITALAKALGMHHEFVKRKLRKLSRGYDANRFGDINEYLAV
ncbi:hypothetical protein [Paenibacillus amylolyticus]|uniref:hypothetical protein n=1 Tax=Paenibacillus amylolyticus TaxID=1451 RepID=UPI003EC137AD